MIIAMPRKSDGQLDSHFGHAEGFVLYELTDNQSPREILIPHPGHDHRKMAELFKSHQVETILAGGMGEGMHQALSDAGINVIVGQCGLTKDLAVAFQAGKVVSDPQKGRCGGGHHHGKVQLG